MLLFVFQKENKAMFVLYFFPGVRQLLSSAPNLEGIRCAAYDVLQALVLHLKPQMEQSSSPSTSCSLRMRYLDFSNGFPIVAKFLPFLPDLMEVRIGSDAPPDVRRNNQVGEKMIYLSYPVQMNIFRG